MMLFEWNEAKAESNLRKHDIRFELAALVFDDPDAVAEQDRTVSGERRWQTIGRVEGVVVLLVGHTV